MAFPDLELRLCWMYFYWTVFNPFIQGMIGGALLGQIPNLVKHPSANAVTITTTPRDSQLEIAMISPSATKSLIWLAA